MTPQEKLEKVEASLRRWQTRLVRATNMVTKLDKQRRRMQLATLPLGKVVAVVTKRIPVAETKLLEDLTALAPEPVTNTQEGRKVVFQSMPDGSTEVQEMPAFLDRRDPVIKAELEAAREAAKKEMPKTGKAALDYIKQSERIKKKREKRDKAFFKEWPPNTPLKQRE